MKKAFSLLLPLGVLLLSACGISDSNAKSTAVDPKDSIIYHPVHSDSITTEIKNAEAELKSFLEKN